MATRIARLGQAARRAISRAIKSLASASLGGETISYVTLGAEVLKSLLIGAAIALLRCCPEHEQRAAGE